MKNKLKGTIVSDKMEKTVVVLVKRRLPHSMYGKLIMTRKKYKVHDESNQVKEGARVKIVNCRPFSKDKRFRVLEVLA